MQVILIDPRNWQSKNTGISSAIFIHVLFLSALPWQWLHLPVGTLRNNLAEGQIQDQPPGIFLFCWEDLTPGSRNPMSPGFPPCSLFAKATKASIFFSLGRMRRSLPHFWGAEYFQYLWNPDSWCFYGECWGLNLKWIWMSCIMQKMLKMTRTVFGLGTCYFKKNVTEGKRTNKEMQNFHSGDLPWRIWHC